MDKLNFPEFQFRTKYEGKALYIWDDIRKKYVVVTPEEWVRQNLVRYFIEVKEVPASLMRVEVGLKLNKMQRRADVVVYNNNGLPLLIAECKAPSVKITQQAFDQIARYNIPLKVKYLVVTNGLVHYFCRIDEATGSYEFLNWVPGYNELS
jgi:hypothetical protein